MDTDDFIRICFKITDRPSTDTFRIHMNANKTATQRGNHILVVEDEQALSSMLDNFLGNIGYRVSCAHDVETAKSLLGDKTRSVELIILDWMLPGTSGAALISFVRSWLPLTDVPVIILTARADEGNKLRAFDLGCDDYITKPFSLNELERRVQAVLKRCHRSHEHHFRAGNLLFDPARQVLIHHNRTISIGKKEFRLLQYFVDNPNKVLSRERLTQYLWPDNEDVYERSIDVYILRLRKLFGRYAASCPIKTVWGSGYYLDQDFHASR